MAAVVPSPDAAAFPRLGSDSLAVSCDCERFFDLACATLPTILIGRLEIPWGPGGQARLAGSMGV